MQIVVNITLRVSLLEEQRPEGAAPYRNPHASQLENKHLREVVSYHSSHVSQLVGVTA